MNQYRRALAEVDAIINYMPQELAMKIPQHFKKMVKEQKENNVKIEINDFVMKNNLLPETVVILGLIYRDYLCSPLEKEKLQAEDKKC